MGESNNKSAGFIHFGLFEGTKRLNHGFGERVYPMDIVDILYRERTFMVKELYVATLVCICASMLFGILAAIAAVVNTASTPSEPVCHFPGMIAWNVIAALASFAALLTWIVQYFVKLRENVLIREDKTRGGWTTAGKANIGHSFWLVVIVFAIFLLECDNLTFPAKATEQESKQQKSHR